MRAAPTLDAKTSTRFAEPPWSEHSEPWLELDAQLPQIIWPETFEAPWLIST